MSARQSAWNLLRQWTDAAAPPQLPERGAPPTDSPAAWNKLAPRDRAFAFDLVTGVIRWRGLLDAVIASRLRMPIENLSPPVRALLWMGAYQLLIQGGTADYAAVDTAVDLAKQYESTRSASGLVNAVLRGITRLEPRRKDVPEIVSTRRSFPLDFSTEVTLNTDLFPDPAKSPAVHLAATRSHPSVYVAYLRKLHDDRTVAALLLRNNQRPLITLRADGDFSPPAGAGLQPHAEAERFWVAADGWNDTIETAVRTGQLSPQDPTAGKPVRAYAALGESPGQILDLCAGLGTKTVQLARQFPNAQVIAADIDARKLERLANRARDLDLKNVHTLVLTAETSPNAAPPAAPLTAHFDLVLVDAPCSNTGVMAKRIQSRWRWPSLDHAALHALQKKLLTQAQSLARPGGIVIYATCSIDPAENGEIVREAPVQKVEETLTLPSLDNRPLAARDGGYYAILRKSA